MGNFETYVFKCGFKNDNNLIVVVMLPLQVSSQTLVLDLNVWNKEKLIVAVMLPWKYQVKLWF